MSSVPRVEPPPGETPGRRLSSFFHRHPFGRVAGLLAAPVGWLVVVYLGSLVLLLMAAFWETETFTNEVVRNWNLDNFRQILEQDVYRDVALRTITMAGLVTIADASSRFRSRTTWRGWRGRARGSPRRRHPHAALGELPRQGVRLERDARQRRLHQLVPRPFGVGPPGDSVGLWLTFTYFWLPFMILPIFTGLERIPSSLLEASGDLGARSLRTFWKVTLPLAFPAVVAGSIFTFSLTLGDFILPTLIANEQFIGTVIYGDRSANLPVASAFAMVPIIVMTVYLASRGGWGPSGRCR